MSTFSTQIVDILPADMVRRGDLPIDPVLHAGARADWDGVSGTNDAPALNAAYALARVLRRSVNLGGRSYRCLDAIDARGVSTVGEGATLSFSLAPANGRAFWWGGANVRVSGVRFELSSSDTAQAMQGIQNNTNDVKGQWFTDNQIVALTSRVDGQANIYGLWCNGTGLSGLHIARNAIEGTYYGVTINAQTQPQENVDEAPIGNPIRDVVIAGNTLVDAIIMVNAPGVYCDHVTISGNTVRPKSGGSIVVDMALSIAHTKDCSIVGNTITGNKTGTTGVMHIEDVSGATAVSGNSIRCLGQDNGISILLAKGVSGDDATNRDRVVVSGNHIIGPGKTGAHHGISLVDTSTTEITIAGNYVRGFYIGVATLAASSCSGNTISECEYGLSLFRLSMSVANLFFDCTTAFYNLGVGQVVQGGMLSNSGMMPNKNTASQFVRMEGVGHRSTVTWTTGVAASLIPLPAGRFSGTVTIIVDGHGFTQNNISWDGSTFTTTCVAYEQPAILGSMVLSRNASGSPVMLDVTPSIGGAGTLTNVGVTVVLSGLTY
jgi:hypothetical protein